MIPSIIVILNKLQHDMNKHLETPVVFSDGANDECASVEVKDEEINLDYVEIEEDE